MNMLTARETRSLYHHLLSASRDHLLPRVTYPKGRLLHQPGDSAQTLYLVHRGHVRIYRLAPDGREVTYALLGAGETVGETAMVSSSGHTSFAEVIGEAELTPMARTLFESLMQRHPEVAHSVMMTFSQRLRRAEDLVDDLVNRDVSSRVARTLLDLATNHGRQAPKSVIIDLHIPYQEIANMVGSTRETVTRAISQMQQNQWVRFQGGQLHLLDRDALTLLAA